MRHSIHPPPYAQDAPRLKSLNPINPNHCPYCNRLFLDNAQVHIHYMQEHVSRLLGRKDEKQTGTPLRDEASSSEAGVEIDERNRTNEGSDGKRLQEYRGIVEKEGERSRVWEEDDPSQNARTIPQVDKNEDGKGVVGGADLVLQHSSIGGSKSVRGKTRQSNGRGSGRFLDACDCEATGKRWQQ